MKMKLIIASLFCMAVSAQAAITIGFSSSTNYLGNFLNGAGSSVDTVEIAGSENRMVWGLLVNSNGGAGLTGGYDGGFSLAANVTGTELQIGGLGSGDVLYIASAVMASNAAATDGSQIGQNRLLTFTGMTLGGGVTSGDSMAIIWFDKLAVGGTATANLKYGIYQLPHVQYDGVNYVDVVPADPANVVFAPAFAGTDAPKAMAFSIVPEPSAALLGAFGVLGLLRRRRI